MRKLLMGSIALTTFAAAIAIFQIASCKKTDAQPPSTTSIEGLWIGTYTVDGKPDWGEQYFSFVIKPDGTVINDTEGESQQHLSIGTWALAGDKFTCTTTCVYGLQSNMGITENHTAIFDKTKGTISNGVWKNVPPLNGSGTFNITKVK
jgi:hypothetical protein